MNESFSFIGSPPDSDRTITFPDFLLPSNKAPCRGGEFGLAHGHLTCMTMGLGAGCCVSGLL